ncbi:MAG TPA: vitamin B12 dependent-methionine synthase activation domain-containing protein, partial [Burkholderiales bacterium]|nr:vitamin B12 dependent-methionine synthase activation domain-containing protein [Burkholderiales bacterium]
QSLLSPEARDGYLKTLRADYARVRAQHAEKKGPGPLHPIAEARRLGLKTDWASYRPPVPKRPGIERLRDYPLERLIPYIDWSPFFQAWELSGSYPKILDDPVVGEQARRVLAEGKQMLAQVVRDKWIRAHGVCGLFPAAQVACDDVEIYADESRSATLMTLYNLRQQNHKPAGRPNLCLADFVAPKDSGVRDYVGAFAVCASGFEARVAAFEAGHDDYSAIMLKVLADRLAEAFAEHLHERVRREFWGYAGDERLASEGLLAEAYRGVRPAPGYPACPDHTAKGPLFTILGAERNTGMQLTESYAMLPASSVSGFYFSHPQSSYFAVGRVGKDQVEDYARRKGAGVEEMERWLAPNLAYEPADIIPPTSR